MAKGRKIAGMIAAAGAVLGTVAVDAPAHAASFGQIPNYGTRKCVDLASENNFWVHQWHCESNDPQQGRLETLVDPANNRWTFTNQRTGQCLAINGNSTAVGTQASMDWCGSPSALWHITYAFNNGSGWHQQLQNVNSGLCLDLRNNSSADGAIIQPYWCTRQSPAGEYDGQLWMM